MIGWMVALSPLIEKGGSRQGLCVCMSVCDNKELCFSHAECEQLVGHPLGDVRQAGQDFRSYTMKRMIC